MSEETGVTTPEAPEVTPAATTEPVATPQGETPAPAEVQKEAEPAKTFTQAELDAIVQKEKAKAARIAESRAMKARIEALERNLQQQAQPSQQPQNTDRPTRANFASDDDYVEAMADWKLEQRDKATRAARETQQRTELANRTEAVYSEAERLPGFDRDAFDSLPLTPAIAAALVDSDVSAKLMHYMAQNPEEVAKIANLPPARQAAAIGRMEAKVDVAPPVSNAPPPMKPVGTRGSASNSDLGRASMEEYIAQRQKQGARWSRW